MSIRIAVRLKPGSSKTLIHGWQEDPLARKSAGKQDGADRILVVSVNAPPLEGRANRMLTDLLAKTLGLPRSAVRIARGESSRIKQIELPATADLSALDR